MSDSRHGEVMREVSRGALVVLCTVRAPPESPEEYESYLAALHLLSAHLPPTLMVHGVQETLAAAL